MAWDTRNFAETLQNTLGKGGTHPVLAFPDGPQAQSGFKYYSQSDLDRLSKQAAAYYRSQGIQVRKRGEPPSRFTIFAYGTIEWAATFYALVRMGHTVVALSSRLSEEYIQGLLAKANADVLIHDRPVICKGDVASIKKVPLPTEQQLEALTPPSDTEVFCDLSIIDKEDICYSCHSSGSTSLPKLFPVSHGEWLSRMKRVEYIYLRTMRVWAASAMYNAVGLIQLSVSVNKEVPSFFENDRMQFTVDGAISFAKEAKPDAISLTPHTLAMMASVPEGVECLRSAKNVSMFGAVCPDELGDRLVAQGVRLSSIYAMTEAGVMGASGARPADDNDWQYISVNPSKKDHIQMRPLEGSDELWQMWSLPGCPEVLPTVLHKDGTFCTGDLFLKHPTKEGRWKIVGRQDDQLKIYQKDRQSIVNAVVYEQKIQASNNDIVDEVILFGQGRSSLGVLVFAEDVSEGTSKRAEVERRIWSTIQSEVNGKLPTPIDRNMMVLVDTKRTSLPQTGKFNLIRPQVYLKYQHLIDQAYDNQEAAKPASASSQKPNGLHHTTSRDSEHAQHPTGRQNNVRL